MCVCSNIYCCFVGIVSFNFIIVIMKFNSHFVHFPNAQYVGCRMQVGILKYNNNNTVFYSCIYIHIYAATATLYPFNQILLNNIYICISVKLKIAFISILYNWK